MPDSPVSHTLGQRAPAHLIQATLGHASISTTGRQNPPPWVDPAASNWFRSNCLRSRRSSPPAETQCIEASPPDRLCPLVVGGCKLRRSGSYEPHGSRPWPVFRKPSSNIPQREPPLVGFTPVRLGKHPAPGMRACDFRSSDACASTDRRGDRAAMIGRPKRARDVIRLAGSSGELLRSKHHCHTLPANPADALRARNPLTPGYRRFADYVICRELYRWTMLLIGLCDRLCSTAVDNPTPPGRDSKHSDSGTYRMAEAADEGTAGADHASGPAPPRTQGRYHFCSRGYSCSAADPLGSSAGYSPSLLPPPPMGVPWPSPEDSDIRSVTSFISMRNTKQARDAVDVQPFSF